ncbi:cysteine-tryptophan domain-containing zinc finger protein 5-like [Oryza brachyantha]|uniref:cysteine-tryptophan domain-containing zinc finger protein 5-like n=1 Tax=Oryza brachyantha TaxID=4533 RepID=UPI0007760529|nr:cysteine-tryptophan domain-containing zinc finger protein 5-like [Oryza brachyantha]
MVGGGGRKRRREEEEVVVVAGRSRGAVVARHEERELDGDASAGGRRSRGDELLDPDQLTYIDEKLQNVLGHFQKKFEGGVSAENLGSQYGGYGSFLPTYQQSPASFQSRSTAVLPNHGSASRSPYMPLESAEENPFVKHAIDSRTKNNYGQRMSTENYYSQQYSGPEQKTAKIRIKVNNKCLARNNAAIYSGLGLDISPSSSIDDSPQGSIEAPESKILPDESADAIFQIMTHHSVPGGFLLSPLPENVLGLRKKSTAVTKKHEAPAYDNNKSELQRNCCHRTSAAPDNNYQLVKKIKCDEQRGHLSKFENSACIHNNATIMKKGTKPELQDISEDTDLIRLPRSAKIDKHAIGESADFMAETSGHLKETKNGPFKGKRSTESSLSIIHVKADNLANDDIHPKGNGNIRITLVRNAFKYSRKENKMEHSLVDGFSHKIKSDERNDQFVATSSQLQIDPPKKISLKRDKWKVVRAKDEPSQYKSKESRSLADAGSMGTTEIVAGNSSELLIGKKVSSLQASLSRKKIKVKTHKTPSYGTPKKPNGDFERDALDHRIDSSCIHLEDKSLKTGSETVTAGLTDKHFSGGGNDEDHKISPMLVDKSVPMPSRCKNETAESSMATPAPKPFDQWVCCDKCETWRLLPYGMNPDILPKKWRCSMQSWLPGMNNCKASGDETNRAVRALYMVPAPENNIVFDSRYDTAALFRSNDAVIASDNLRMAKMSKSSVKLDAPRNPDDLDCFPKLREKQKRLEPSDKGQTFAKDQMHPKGKSSGSDYDNLIKSKKLKKVYDKPPKNHPPEFESKSSPSTKETLKELPKHSNISPGMGMYASPSSSKRFCDGDNIFSNRRTRASDTRQSDLQDLSIKKNKSKQMQLKHHGPYPLACDAFAKHVVNEALSESNAAKERPVSDLKYVEVNDHEKSAHARGPFSGMDSNAIYGEKEGLGEKNLENMYFQHPLLSESSVRRNICNVQASTAATSSSSKVSSSHKIIPDFQETRTSPVESVSSSPLRTSEKKNFDRHRTNSCTVAGILHSQELAKTGASCSKEKYGFECGSGHTNPHVSGCSNGDMHQDAWEDGDLQKDKQDLLTNGLCNSRSSGLGIRHDQGQLNPVVDQKVNLHVLSIHGNGDFRRPTPNQSGKTLSQYNSNQTDQTKMSSGKQPTQAKPDKGNVEYRYLKTNPSTVEGSKLLPGLNNRVNGNTSYKAKQSNKSVAKNMKHAILNADASIQSNASVLLKEARDLKHLSDRLKGKGDDLESANMCFEACLKFLYVASIKETPGIDSSKQGDTLNIMTLYSATGNLCGFCAREFERLKKMANAALAYKCVEVAYMKAAFYKHPGASKNSHELQAAYMMAPPAESPSSSASDVDNLNNPITVAKIAITRDLCSFQISKNSISRNNHHLMGLLAYAEDTNYAFEGTRKSQSAFSAYISGLKKDQSDGIGLLRDALNFNFHNVKGLLQLIRMSLECINHESVK